MIIDGLQINDWSREIGESLQDGKVDWMVQDRQDLVIEGLVGLADALEEDQPKDEETFEENQQPQEWEHNDVSVERYFVNCFNVVK